MALKRREKGELTIIPVLLRRCDWSSSDLAEFQCLPRNAVPVTEWENADAAFLDVLSGIRTVVGGGVSPALNPETLPDPHTAAVLAVAVSLDGTLALSGSADGVIRVWDLENKPVTRKLRGASVGVLDFAIAPDRSRLLSVHRDGSMHVWDVATGMMNRSVAKPFRWTVAAGWMDSEFLLHVATFGYLGVFGATTGWLLHGLPVTPDISAGALLPARGDVVTGHRNGTCRLWSIRDQHQPVRAFGHDDPVQRVAISPDARVLAATDVRKGIAV